MAKTYLSAAKYIIHTKFEISGIVDNPDIIGAIFGQSEGLLGDEMDLKELQKNGKVGRVEIVPETKMGRTTGTLTIPTSMDMVQTSVLAAAMESVDKVGPYEAKFETENLEDARSEKRSVMKIRAQELLKKFMTEQSPDTTELTEEIREGARAADIQSYGPENLPCGPDVFTSNELIVVEGRADVINLLKNGVKNVIGFGGANISPTLKGAARGKKVIAFLDGDRGGELILRKLKQLITIDEIANAPAGKEVEELTRKEIVGALRKTDSADSSDFKPRREYKPRAGYERKDSDTHSSYSRPTRERAPAGERSPSGSYSSRTPTGSYSDRTPRGSYSDRTPRGSYSDRTPGSSYDRRPGRGSSSGNYSRGRSSDTGYSSGRSPRGSYGEERRPYGRRFEPEASPEDIALYSPALTELKGSLKAKLLDEKMSELGQVNVRELVSGMEKFRNVSTVVFDGIVTKRLVDAAEKAGVKTVVGVKKGKLENKENVKVVTISV